MSKKLIIILSFVVLISLLLCGCMGSVSSNKNYGSGNKNNYSSSSKPEAQDAASLLLEGLSYEDIPEEELTADELLSNAILDKLYLTIISETSQGFTVKIRYPDVYTAFIEETKKYSSTPTEEDVNSLLSSLTEKVKNSGCEMLEETFELAFNTDENGNKSIVWTDEVLHAVSGGLYTAIEE